jgi:nucleotide-binding universal stress UspA family protein
MLQLKSILCATDLGEKSLEPTKLAIQWAKTFHAQLKFLYADTFSFSMTSLAGSYLPPEEFSSTWPADREERARTYFTKILHDLDPSGEKYPLDYKVGAPSIILHDYEKKHGSSIDLMVLGSPPHSTLKGFFMGSVGENIVRSSAEPVLVVRDQKATHPKKILFATDLTKAHNEAKKWCQHLAKTFNAEVKGVYVMAPFEHEVDPLILMEDTWGGQAHHWENLYKTLENTHKEEMGKLSREFQAEGINFEGQILKGKGNKITPYIQDFFDKNNCDLLVIGGHSQSVIERFFLGSQALGTLREFKGSFLLAK